MTEGGKNNHSEGVREDRARNNMTALSIFYGFLFVFGNALAAAATAIAEGPFEIRAAFYIFLVLLGVAQLAIGQGLYLETMKIGIPDILKYGLHVFVGVAPVFYVLFLGWVIGLTSLELFLGMLGYILAGLGFLALQIWKLR